MATVWMGVHRSWEMESMPNAAADHNGRIKMDGGALALSWSVITTAIRQRQTVAHLWQCEMKGGGDERTRSALSGETARLRRRPRGASADEIGMDFGCAGLSALLGLAT
jgi:hypothetical protein